MNYGTFFAEVIGATQNKEVECAEVAMEMLASAGIMGTDVHAENFRTYGVEPIKKLHDNAGMRVTSVFHILHGDYKNPAEVKTLIAGSELDIENCAKAGSKLLMGVPLISVPHTCPQDRVDTLKGIAEYLGGISEIAEQYGVTVTVENYSETDTALSYISDIEYILENAPKVRYVFDSGNFWFGGDDMLKACKKFADKTVHVHLKDLKERKGGELNICGKEVDCVAIGDGILPNYEAIEFLKSTGYDGAYIIEVTHTPGMSRVFKSLENLKNNIK